MSLPPPPAAPAAPAGDAAPSASASPFAAAAPADPGARRRLALQAAFLVLLAAAVYAVAVPGELVFDDVAIVKGNPRIKAPFDFSALFLSPYWKGEAYRPLAMFLFWCDYHVYRLHSYGYHLTNLALYGLNVVLAFLLARRLLPEPRAAWIAGLLFAVLPAHAEPVASIAQRDALLAFGGYALAWLLYLRGDAPGLVGALVAYFFALLGKEDAGTLPAALLLGDWLLGRIRDPRSAAAAAGRFAAFLVPLAAYLLLRRWVLGELGAGDRRYFQDATYLVVLLTMARFILRHDLPGLTTGFGLSCDYVRPSLPDVAPGDLLAWVELAALAAVALAAAASFARRRGPVACGLCLILLTALPTSNLVLRIWALGAQRYMYLPSLGWCLALAALLAGLRARRAAVGAGLEIAVVVLYGLTAASEAAIWRNPDTLYGAMLARTPDNTNAMFNLAWHRHQHGERAEAERLYRRVAELNPEDVLPDVHLALLRLEEGKLDAALEHYRHAQGKGLRERELPWLGAADVLRRQGKMAEARVCLEQAFKEAPDAAEPWQRLGEMQVEEGNLAEAEASLRRALKLDPDRLAALSQLAALLRRRGAGAEALRWAETATVSAPDYPPAWNDLGLAREAVGEFAAAEAAYRRALELDPDWPPAWQNLGVLLLNKLQRAAEAAEALDEALRREPGLHEARLQLGLAYARMGRMPVARELWMEYLKAVGDDPAHAAGAAFAREALRKLGDGK
ncbi:MAG: tetratricopeptide repeat protein [Planctomycetes bacterium]|nr:tetratricopeptide repeat protein [Planctomycetota bacterium]